eukprot:6031687-Prymnesium_polylepis.1
MLRTSSEIAPAWLLPCLYPFLPASDSDTDAHLVQSAATENLMSIFEKVSVPVPSCFELDEGSDLRFPGRGGVSVMTTPAPPSPLSFALRCAVCAGIFGGLTNGGVLIFCDRQPKSGIDLVRIWTETLDE